MSKLLTAGHRSDVLGNNRLEQAEAFYNVGTSIYVTEQFEPDLQ